MDTLTKANFAQETDLKEKLRKRLDELDKIALGELGDVAAAGDNTRKNIHKQEDNLNFNN